MQAGCSEQDISQLETTYQLVLPQFYRKWLLVNGRVPPRSLTGSDCHFPNLLNLKFWAEELLAENGSPFELKANEFVFFMHQGYHFLYFEASTPNADPDIYEFVEGWRNAKPLAKKLSEWLESV